MNKIKMHLNEGPFRAIQSGKKRFEYRVNDEKRRRLEVGDEVEFSLRPDDVETFVKTIIGIHAFTTFDEMFKAFPPHDGNLNPYSFYSKDEEEKYGVVAVELE